MIARLTAAAVLGIGVAAWASIMTYFWLSELVEGER